MMIADALVRNRNQTETKMSVSWWQNEYIPISRLVISGHCLDFAILIILNDMYILLQIIKGAVRFGTFKSIDFKKNWYVKVPVVPRSLML